MNIIEERWSRTEWFRQARFGMFIHWGIYSIPARGEWVRSQEQISIEAYQTYFEEFNPTCFNPKDWAKAAKEAGMKYAVMTAKHHDGFCLFDSKLTDYKATNTPAGRDLLRDYIDAFRAEGLKVGLYYSLLDWHHPDYPAFGDSIHPMRNNVEFEGKKQDFNKYVEYMHGQVKELLTGYGKLDIMWFDFSYGDMTGEMWGATALIEMIKKLQPHIIIDNRLGGNLKSSSPEVYSGDFASPEQIIPPHGLKSDAGDPVPWEACITMNDHWGYCALDYNYKSPKLLVRTLVECVSKNGNLLLNVGPDAKGCIPKQSLDILKVIGEWVDKNGDSVYGCGTSSIPKPEWGRYTQKGKQLYAHVYEKGIGPINLVGLNGKIKKARLLSDRSEVQVKQFWNTSEFKDDVFINFSGLELPDEIDTVIELELI